ncbi:MAG: heme-binding protein [Verrucomicrobiota bacterium]
MKLKRMGWILGILFLTVIAGLWVTTSRAGYESARYKVEEKEGSFEVRIYESHEVVATSMEDGKQNGSFGKLFGYISGDNEDQQKIKMTTPVFMPATGDGKTQEMQFVIPQDVSEAGAPEPSKKGVKKKSMSGGKMAVIRFSGRNDAAQRKKKLAELREKLSEKNLTAVGDPIYAGYDPPWTPGPMRRNEVLIRVK